MNLFFAPANGFTMSKRNQALRRSSANECPAGAPAPREIPSSPPEIPLLFGGGVFIQRIKTGRVNIFLFAKHQNYSF